jgi:hypothetical protein
MTSFIPVKAILPFIDFYTFSLGEDWQYYIKI